MALQSNEGQGQERHESLDEAVALCSGPCAVLLGCLTYHNRDVARIATAMVKGRDGDALMGLQRRDQLRQTVHPLDGLTIERQQDILDLKTGLPQRAIRVDACNSHSLR